jgi:N utilization substance protein B
VLEGWSFDRLGCIEQAILLNGCAEFDLKQVEAAVIIDEYVRLAKKYCDSDSYRLINGVLDRI